MLVIANPGKRLDAFLAAAEELNIEPPTVLHHQGLLESMEALEPLHDADVRVDSYGRDVAVETALIGLGREPDGIEPRQRQRGEMLAPAQMQRGWLRYLERLQAALPHARFWSPPWAMGELFDKTRVHERLREADVPVPDALPRPTSVAALRRALDNVGWPRVFAKLASGSSAAGIASWDREAGTIITTLERDGERWFNTRKLVRLNQRDEIDDVLEFIVTQGAHVERDIELARIEGRRFDLRVLVIAGEPAFVVGRSSAHPMTNLHLGGTRVEVEDLKSVVPPDAWDAALDAAVRTAGLYECHHLGVDIGFDAKTFRPHVLEANAFGDFLPRLKKDGLSVMAWEIRKRCGVGASISISKN